MWQELAHGMQILLSDWNVLVLVLGVAWGIFCGALPGITGSIGVALLLPFTYGMEPAGAIIMLCASYSGSMFGGSISTILLGVPGTASAAATLLDGRALYERGQGGLAVGVALTASAIGGVIGSVILILFATGLATVALAFGPPEYLALGVFGLTILSSLSKNIVKGFIAGIIGMMVATVGLDHFSGMSRYTFGMHELLNGIDFLPALIGLFALAEIFKQSGEGMKSVTDIKSGMSTATLPSFKQLRSLWKSIGIGGVIGTVIGIMPGAGGSISSWVAYSQARNASKTPEEFGHGSLEGIAAPESANNAGEGGSLIPTLALGIPGSNTTAIMMAALTLHGISPGPMLFVEHPEVVNGVYVAVFFANFVMLALGYVALKPVLGITKVPQHMVLASIFLLVCVGIFALQNNTFDLKVMLVFGLMGLVMKKFGFPMAAAVLGLILGPIIEPALMRSLILSNGSWSIFFTRPISCGLLILTAISFGYPLIRSYLRERKAGVRAA